MVYYSYNTKIFFMPPKVQDSKVYDADVEKNKSVAALSYLWILCLVPLLMRRSSKFAQFHAKQGVVLFIAEMIISILMWIPVFGQLLLVLAIIIAALGFIKSYNGEWWKAPFIYEWSQKIKL